MIPTRPGRQLGSFWRTRRMPWDTIHKEPAPLAAEPNLRDYAATRAAFRWDDVRAELAMPTPGTMNIAYHALDRHVRAGRGGKLALRWLGKDGETVDLTYGELTGWTCRFANLLRRLGIGEGDRVFSLLGRTPELYVTALGTLRNGSVF